MPDTNIYVYAREPGADDRILSTAAHVLSPAEQTRAARIRVPAARHRFGLARILLRSVLGADLGTAPEAVPLSISEGGKPVLDGTPGFEFNLSHSGDLVVLATSADAVGVDVERMRTRRRMMQIARAYYNPREYHWLESMPESAREPGFYRYWTVKEAYTKCLGLGLSHAFKSFSCELGPPITVDDPDRSTEEFRLMGVEGRGYQLAVCVRSREPVSANLNRVSVSPSGDLDYACLDRVGDISGWLEIENLLEPFAD